MSTILVDNLTGKTSAGSITVTSEGGAATQSLQQGLAKAWAFTDGTGTASVSDSLNIGGLTDNGTGDYTFSFSSAMGNATYGGGSSAASSQANGHNFQLHIFNTTSIRTRAENSSGTLTDCARLVFNITGDLA
jgi:hypothetical protein